MRERFTLGIENSVIFKERLQSMEDSSLVLFAVQCKRAPTMFVWNLIVFDFMTKLLFLAVFIFFIFNLALYNKIPL